MIKLSFALLITGNVTFLILTKTTTNQILTLQNQLKSTLFGTYL